MLLYCICLLRWVLCLIVDLLRLFAMFCDSDCDNAELGIVNALGLLWVAVWVFIFSV